MCLFSIFRQLTAFTSTLLYLSVLYANLIAFMLAAAVTVRTMESAPPLIALVSLDNFDNHNHFQKYDVCCKVL